MRKRVLDRSEETFATPLRATFVLPGRGRSGGVRVTVEMANRLLRRGHNVRIVWRTTPVLTHAGLRDAMRTTIARLAGHRHADWLDEFEGPSCGFSDLNSLTYAADEIVIAVGSMTVRDVQALRRDVVKVRYCHGFSDNQPGLTEATWTQRMHTIAVSPTLLPRLGDLCGMGDAPVIPNGVNMQQYYPDGHVRDGVGAIFSRHYLKAPEDTIAVLQRLAVQWPDVARHVFGEGLRPRELPRDCYHRLPSVEKARELYSRSKVWILTSRSEGLPGPVLEAMACGCAIVSSRQAGSASIIRDGYNGFLLPVGDVSAFVDRVGMLLRDEPRRAAMADAGMRTAGEYSWERAVLKMEAYLNSLQGRQTQGMRPERCDPICAAETMREAVFS